MYADSTAWWLGKAICGSSSGEKTATSSISGPALIDSPSTSRPRYAMPTMLDAVVFAM